MLWLAVHLPLLDRIFGTLLRDGQPVRMSKRRGEFVLMEELLEEAAAVEPSHPLIHSALAQSWTLLGYDEKARAEAKRALAAAKDRGLANVCWALLNSTEFIYVR